MAHDGSDGNCRRGRGGGTGSRSTELMKKFWAAAGRSS